MGQDERTVVSVLERLIKFLFYNAWTNDGKDGEDGNRIHFSNEFGCRLLRVGINIIEKALKRAEENLVFREKLWHLHRFWGNVMTIISLSSFITEGAADEQVIRVLLENRFQKMSAGWIKELQQIATNPVTSTIRLDSKNLENVFRIVIFGSRIDWNINLKLNKESYAVFSYVDNNSRFFVCDQIWDKLLLASSDIWAFPTEMYSDIFACYQSMSILDYLYLYDFRCVDGTQNFLQDFDALVFDGGIRKKSKNKKRNGKRKFKFAGDTDDDDDDDYDNGGGNESQQDLTSILAKETQRKREYFGCCQCFCQRYMNFLERIRDDSYSEEMHLSQKMFGEVSKGFANFSFVKPKTVYCIVRTNVAIQNHETTQPVNNE